MMKINIKILAFLTACSFLVSLVSTPIVNAEITTPAYCIYDATGKLAKESPNPCISKITPRNYTTGPI